MHFWKSTLFDVTKSSCTSLRFVSTCLPHPSLPLRAPCFCPLPITWELHQSRDQNEGGKSSGTRNTYTGEGIKMWKCLNFGVKRYANKILACMNEILDGMEALAVWKDYCWETSAFPAAVGTSAHYGEQHLSVPMCPIWQCKVLIQCQGTNKEV